MNALAEALGGIIATHVSSARSGGRDCRLIFPGLTEPLACELHQKLRNIFQLEGIPVPVYLALDDSRQGFDPSQEKGWLRAEALTSVRHGSFVTVCMPKVLPKLHDSVRGSGSPIRAETFSDEWPWQDEGLDTFRFDGPILDAILDNWGTDDGTRNKIRQVILKGLLPATASLSDASRVRILVQEILGSFNPTHYPELDDVFDQFCFHCGIPRLPPQSDVGQRHYIAKVKESARKLDELRTKDSGFRAHIIDEVIPSVFDSHSDVASLQDAVQRMLDGALSLGVDSGLLAYHGGLGYGSTSENTESWRLLDVDTLCKLFGARQEAVISCEIRRPQPSQGFVSADNKSAAIFAGANLEIGIQAEVSEADFVEHGMSIRCKRGQHKIWEIRCNQRTVKQSKLVSEEHLPKSGRCSLLIELVRLNKAVADARLRVHVCGGRKPGLAVLDPGFHVVDLVEIDPDEPECELDPMALSFQEPVMARILDWQGNTPCEVLADDSAQDVVTLGSFSGAESPGSAYKLAKVIDVEEYTGGRVELRIEASGRGRDVTVEGTGEEPGEFTLEDELRVATATSNERRLRRVFPCFSGEGDAEGLVLPVLGGINTNSRRRMDLAKHFETRSGWKPVILDFLADGPLPDVQENAFWKATDEGPRFLSGADLPEKVLTAVSRYEDCRDELLVAARARLASYSTNAPQPLYVVVPNYVEWNAQKDGQIVGEYLSAYCDILDILRSPGLTPASAFLLANLDAVVLDQAEGVRSTLDMRLVLLGPWHPLIVAKRYMVQQSLVAVAGSVVSGKKNHCHLVSLFAGVDGFRGYPWIRR